MYLLPSTPCFNLKRENCCAWKRKIQLEVLAEKASILLIDSKTKSIHSLFKAIKKKKE